MELGHISLLLLQSICQVSDILEGHFIAASEPLFWNILNAPNDEKTWLITPEFDSYFYFKSFRSVVSREKQDVNFLE